jgi:ComF family protein
MADFKEILIRIADAVWEAVYPTQCAACSQFFPPPPREALELKKLEDISFQKVMSPFLCPKCAAKFKPIQDAVYGGKMSGTKQFRTAWAVGAYTEEIPFAKAIRAFKYDRQTQLANPFGKLLFSAFKQYWDTGEIDVVTPVPLHIKRLRKRGFNQSYLLIRKWPRLAKSLNADISSVQIERELLIRSRDTLPQARMKTAEDRRKNIKDAFQVRASSEIAGKKILLVDDIFTTGSTADECAGVLLDGGAEYVDILTLAQTR